MNDVYNSKLNGPITRNKNDVIRRKSIHAEHETGTKRGKTKQPPRLAVVTCMVSRAFLQIHFSNLSPGTVWCMPAVKFALHRSLFQGIYRMHNLEQETSLLISSCTKTHWKMSSKFKGSSFSKTKKAFLSVFSKWKLTEEDINPIFPSINSGLLAFFRYFIATGYK